MFYILNFLLYCTELFFTMQQQLCKTMRYNAVSLYCKLFTQNILKTMYYPLHFSMYYTLYYTVLYCTVLRYTKQSNTLRDSTTLYNAILYYVILYFAVLFKTMVFHIFPCTVLYCAVLCCAVLYHPKHIYTFLNIRVWFIWYVVCCRVEQSRAE